ncbi:LacI family DNA-binding transcriptional regulator [Propioniciclava soli]|uniref:LacI family DNA-binding transcriptional regulator n=1 Tax=Propioniciclava soli TaxID=2775081 RepID=UPI001E5A9F11|nr:LacI family DNA-binding transcriptional regulator [Propioniciclava soli]
MVTMQDVARRAGVSAMTVSNVVNERHYVREETRRKVSAAIEELGYTVNTTARNLRQGRTGVIGLALSEIDRPYFGRLSALVVRRARQHGYEVVIEITGDRREGEMAAIQHSRLRSYDGLLLYASQLKADDSSLLRADYPIVLFGERTYTTPVDHVVVANAEGGALAARHLLERGCSRLAMVGGRWSDGDDADVATARTQGFADALRDAGQVLDPEAVRDTPYTLPASRDAVGSLLAVMPDVDGIFCATDWVALGVMRGLADHGLRIPEDVKVIGFDDVEEAAFARPSLSSIAPDLVGMVDAALGLLVERVAGSRGADDYREVVGGVQLRARESTADERGPAIRAPEAGGDPHAGRR